MVERRLAESFRTQRRRRGKASPLWLPLPTRITKPATVGDFRGASSRRAIRTIQCRPCLPWPQRFRNCHPPSRSAIRRRLIHLCRLHQFCRPHTVASILAPSPLGRPCLPARPEPGANLRTSNRRSMVPFRRRDLRPQAQCDPGTVLFNGHSQHHVRSGLGLWLRKIDKTPGKIHPGRNLWRRH